MNGGSGVCFARSSSSSWSRALKPAPMIAAPSDIVNGPIERPRYMGLPWRRYPSVPSSLGMSTMNAPSIAQCAGIVPPSNVMLCDPEPLSPIVWPQSFSISQTPRGA